MPSIAPAVASATALAISTPLYDGVSSTDATHQRAADVHPSAPAHVQTQAKANKLPHSLNISNSGHSISTGKFAVEELKR